MNDRAHLIINALLFQVTWFACVLGGAAGQPFWGFLGVGVLLGLVASRPSAGGDLLLMGLLGVVGFSLDSLWVQLGVLSYGDSSTAPAWIAGLWLGFALTVNHSLAWLQQRPWLAAVLAAAFAPITYIGGERLGAVEIVDAPGLALVSAAWGVLFFLLFTRASELARIGTILPDLTAAGRQTD